MSRERRESRESRESREEEKKKRREQREGATGCATGGGHDNVRSATHGQTLIHLFRRGRQAHTEPTHAYTHILFLSLSLCVYISLLLLLFCCSLSLIHTKNTQNHPLREKKSLSLPLSLSHGETLARTRTHVQHRDRRIGCGCHLPQSANEQAHFDLHRGAHCLQLVRNLHCITS